MHNFALWWPHTTFLPLIVYLNQHQPCLSLYSPLYRYPSFVDAVRDLDDALTMVNLFAMLPAEKKYEIPVKAVQMARRLSLEFNAYVVRTNALRKVFVSIKGFYYQV